MEKKFKLKPAEYFEDVETGEIIKEPDRYYDLDELLDLGYGRKTLADFDYRPMTEADKETYSHILKDASRKHSDNLILQCAIGMCKLEDLDEPLTEEEFDMYIGIKNEAEAFKKVHGEYPPFCPPNDIDY